MSATAWRLRVAIPAVVGTDDTRLPEAAAGLDDILRFAAGLLTSFPAWHDVVTVGERPTRTLRHAHAVWWVLCLQL